MAGRALPTIVFARNWLRLMPMGLQPHNLGKTQTVRLKAPWASSEEVDDTKHYNGFGKQRIFHGKNLALWGIERNRVCRTDSVQMQLFDKRIYASHP